MKINDIKHNHSLTDLLKVILFTLIMLAPIGSIASRCLYVICNKNAHESYYGETINEEEITLLNDISNFEPNKKYQFNSGTFDRKDTTFPQSNYLKNIVVENSEIITTNITSLENVSISKFALYLDANGVLSILINNETSPISLTTNNLVFNFYYVSDNETYNFAYNDLFYTITYNKYSYLDNVFEYSVANIENNQLFNWTQNTALYTGINAMCTNLQIGGSAIPIILTYWTLITIIYVIIDIVLKMFTTLTHLLSKKT